MRRARFLATIVGFLPLGVAKALAMVLGAITKTPVLMLKRHGFAALHRPGAVSSFMKVHDALPETPDSAPRARPAYG